MHSKIIVFNKSYNKEKKAELSLLRFLLSIDFNYKIMLRIHLKYILPIYKNINYIPSFSLGYVSANNYTDVISIYKKDYTFNYINKNSIDININIKPKQIVKNDNYFNEWSNSDNDFN